MRFKKLIASQLYWRYYAAAAYVHVRIIISRCYWCSQCDMVVMIWLIYLWVRNCVYSLWMRLESVIIGACIYCKTWYLCMPFISRISWPRKIIKNNWVANIRMV